MPYAKQVVTLYFLMLFLQASWCSNKQDKNLPITPQVAVQKRPLDDTEKRQDKKIDYFDPEFDLSSDPDYNPNFNPNYTPKSDAGYDSDASYDSGYETDEDADAQANKGTYTKPKPTQQPSTSLDFNTKDTTFNFEYKIETFRKEADERRGIKWTLDAYNNLIRTVNNHGSSLYAAEDYVVQGMNIYRAAKKICELYGQGGSVFEAKSHKFLKYYSDHSEKPEDFWINTIKKINKAVVLHLHKRGVLKGDAHSINAKLRLAENYVGLEDTHYNVTTTFTIEGKKFALEDKRWLPLTEKQKQAYLNRKSEKWYKRLDLFEQKFIDAYVDKLLDGRHYIPTQLRSIPGCRNAYQKRILAYDANNNETVLGRYYHSGSLVSPIQWVDKETDWEITQDNWQQVQQQDKNVEVISLNYNLDLPGFEQLREKKIVEDTKKVVGADQFMNLSINGVGTSFNLNNQYNKLLKDAITVYQNKYPDLCRSFTKDQKFKLFRTKDRSNQRNTQIAKIKDLKDKSFFERLGELEKVATTSQLWNNLKQTTYVTDNPNATICANYTTCRALLESTSLVLFSCKSGKDRTGLISYLVDRNIISTYHSCLNEDKDNKVSKALAYSGHYQWLAQTNGGMPGRFGMKPVRGNEASHQFASQLFPKAATLTNISLGKEAVETIE